MSIKPFNRNVQMPFVVVSMLRQQPRKFLVIAGDIETACHMVRESYSQETIVSAQALEVDTILMNSDEVLDQATEAGPSRIIKGN